MRREREKLVGMVKPTTHGSGSHDALVKLLPSDIRTETFYCGIKDGTVEEFETVIPEYRRAVHHRSPRNQICIASPTTAS